MKTNCSLAFIVSVGVGVGTLSFATASDILWTSPQNNSSAWIIANNWSGGVMPLAGDVAQFNNVGGTTFPISYSMTHGLNPTPNKGNIGAVQVLSSRISNLEIQSNSNLASSFNYHGQTVNSITHTVISNESAANLLISSTGAGAATVGLTTSTDSVIQVNSSGNITINLPITGASSRLVVRGGGVGVVTLAGASSTYSGGTRIENGGTLILSANSAAGTGAISNAGGTLKISANLSLTNAVNLLSETAVYQRQFDTGNLYSSYSAKGDLGGTQTTAALLAGSAGAARTLDTSFTATGIVATNDNLRLGEVFNFTGTSTDIYVLQLSLDAVPVGSSLGWLDGTEWVNAIYGNSGTGAQAIQNYQGSFALSGVSASADYLGSWGYDASAKSVWAVVDYSGGSFAVIPEPTPLTFLLGFGALGFACLYFCKRKSCEDAMQ